MKKTSTTFRIAASALICLPFMGCAVSQHAKLNREVRRSFLRWNLNLDESHACDSNYSNALTLASQKPAKLRELMNTCAAPDRSLLIGAWKGINKGLGPAIANLTQDTKVFESSGDCIHGYNISVVQVPIDRLECDGWRPKFDAKSGEVETIGNFIVQVNQRSGSVELDYSIADNVWNDPSKVLIDELVMIDENLLLGRANAKIGLLKIPIAYFVLYR